MRFSVREVDTNSMLEHNWLQKELKSTFVGLMANMKVYSHRFAKLAGSTKVY